MFRGLDGCHEARYILCDISLGLIRFFRGHVFAEKKYIYIYMADPLPDLSCTIVATH